MLPGLKYLKNVFEEAEERYIRELDMLNDVDSDIKFSEIDRRTTRKLTAMTILFSPTLLNGGTLLDPFKSLNVRDVHVLGRGL
jgi:hypothetical protein